MDLHGLDVALIIGLIFAGLVYGIGMAVRKITGSSGSKGLRGPAVVAGVTAGALFMVLLNIGEDIPDSSSENGIESASSTDRKDRRLEKVKKSLLEDERLGETYRLMQELDPEQFDILAGKLAAAVYDRSATEESVFEQSQKAGFEYVRAKILYADDESVIAYWDIVRAQIAKSTEKDPGLCKKVLEGSLNLSATVSGGALDESLLAQALRKLHQGRRPERQPAMPSAEVMQLIDQHTETYVLQVNRDAFERLKQGQEVADAELCRMTRDLIDYGSSIKAPDRYASFLRGLMLLSDAPQETGTPPAPE